MLEFFSGSSNAVNSKAALYVGRCKGFIDTPGKNLRRMLKQGRASVREGRSLLIYPEGGRVPPGEHRAFSRGLGPLYRHCECDVVPFVTNAGLHWPSGFQTKHPGVITIRFFPPIPPGTDVREFTRDIENLLNTEKDKLATGTALRLRPEKVWTEAVFIRCQS